MCAFYFQNITSFYFVDKREKNDVLYEVNAKNQNGNILFIILPPEMLINKAETVLVIISNITLKNITMLQHQLARRKPKVLSWCKF